MQPESFFRCALFFTALPLFALLLTPSEWTADARLFWAIFWLGAGAGVVVFVVPNAVCVILRELDKIEGRLPKKYCKNAHTDSQIPRIK